MGRTCAVPGCESGRGKDNTRRKRLGLRRCVLFSIPTCNARRNQWKKILECALDANQFVCENHFLEGSIKKFDKVVLADGTVFVSPLAQWRLTADALPISPHHEPMDLENNSGSIGQMKQDDNAVSTKKNECPSDPIVLNETTVAVSSIPTEPRIEEVWSIPTEPRIGEVWSIATEPRIGEVSSIPTEPRIGEVWSIATEPRIEEVSSTSTGPRIGEESSIPTEPRIEEVFNNVEMAAPAFTMDTLTNKMNTGLLPESWAWTQKSSGAIFTLVGRSNFQPQLHLEVALDLTLHIRTNTDTVIPLNDKVTCMKDIHRYLTILKKSPMCGGTGIESESRDPNCIGILDRDEAGKYQRRNLRCTLCQRLRRVLRKRNERNKQLARKESQGVNKVDLARRNFIRLKRQTKKLLADVADLTNELENRKKIA